MPRHIQSISYTAVYDNTFKVPIIGDKNELLAITERSYTYRLRNANPLLRPSKFSRQTVNRIFFFMIEQLRYVRNTGSKQVKDYGVEKFLAILREVEDRWKTCTSWKSTLVFELQFQFPIHYQDIVPREIGSNWSFCYQSAIGQLSCYELPILRINDACVEGLEWMARFSRANPELGDIVPPELIRAAFKDYICRIIPKPGSVMRSVFFEQFQQQLREQRMSTPQESTQSNRKPKSQLALSYQGPELKEQSENRSAAESKNKSHHGHKDGSSLAKDGSSPDKRKGGDGAPEKEVSNNSSKTPDQTYCSVGIEMRCVSGTITNVPQNFESLDKADASVIAALCMLPDSKIVKRPRSLSPVGVSEKDQSLELYGSRKKLRESPRHKRLKMSGETGTDSNIDMDISAKSWPRSSHQEDSNPGLIIDAEVESERISSPNSQVEDNSEKQHPSNPFKLSSRPEQDLYPIKTVAHAHSSNLSPSSIWIANNSNAIISEAKVLAHPDNSAIELQYAQFMQPAAKSFQTLILPLHDRTSPKSRPTERGPRPDMLTALERHLDDLDALSVEVSADADT